MRLPTFILAATLPLLNSALSAQAPMTFSADKVDYSAYKAILDGSVTVDHPLGKMSAQHVVITPTLEKKLQIGKIALDNDVNITLNEGGQLTCAQACLDFLEMTGEFQGETTYTETCRGSKKELIPLIVKSQKMTLFLAHPDSGEPSAKAGIQEIVADGGVNVNYNHDLIASGDKGIYIRRSPALGESLPQGTVTLLMHGDDACCKVVNRGGDLIRASSISIDTGAKLLTFTKANGLIHGRAAEEKKGIPIEFSAGTLLWDNNTGTMTLEEHVSLSQQGLGSLKTEGKTRFIRSFGQGKSSLSRMETEGATTVVFREPGKNVDHTLTCKGSAVVDHINMMTTMESPRNSKGKVATEDQVSFQHTQGDVFSDKAVLTYSFDEKGRPALSKVTLEGNVRLKGKLSENGEPLHYAIADMVEFLPAAHEMTFSSKAKRRVLFYDKINNVQVSAPALIIKKDEATGKESVKGVGDVRFSFADQEYAQLRKRFKLDEQEVSDANP